MTLELVRKALEKQGVTDFEPVKAYAGFFGALLMYSSHTPEVGLRAKAASCPHCGDYEPSTRPIRLAGDFSDDFVNLLESHPHVESVTRTRGEFSVYYPTMYGGIVEEDALTIHLNIPRRHQKASQLMEEAALHPDRFQVITRGSIFLAACEIDRIPVRATCSHEFVGLVRQLTSSFKGENEDDEWHSKRIAPTPLHSTVYVVIGRPTSEPQRNRVIKAGKSLLLLMPERKPGHDYLSEVYDELHDSLVFYYKFLCELEHVQYLQREAEEAHDDAETALDLLRAQPFFRIRLYLKLHAAAKREIAHLRRTIIDFHSLSNRVDYLETYAKRVIARDSLLHHVEEELFAGLPRKPQLSAALENASAQIGADLDQIRGQDLLYVVSFGSAIAGSLLTWLLTLALG